VQLKQKTKSRLSTIIKHLLFNFISQQITNVRPTFNLSWESKMIYCRINI